MFLKTYFGQECLYISNAKSTERKMQLILEQEGRKCYCIFRHVYVFLCLSLEPLKENMIKLLINYKHLRQLDIEYDEYYSHLGIFLCSIKLF